MLTTEERSDRLPVQRQGGCHVKRKMYRQGDVLLMQIDEMPGSAQEGTPDGDRIVLAYGEVTGHAHAVAAELARIFVDKETRFLHVGDGGASLVHEEHATIALDPGVYRIVHQREYVPNSSRYVLD
jgi:hypothetical protein